MSNKHLNRAKNIIDDEYYTLYEDVLKVFKNSLYTHPLINNLDNKTILFAADDESSNFVRVGREYNLNFEFSKDIEQALIKAQNNNYVVVTNPPFSKLTEISKLLQTSNFVLLVPITFFKNKYIIKMLNDKSLYISNFKVSNFLHNSELTKLPECYWISNIPFVKEQIKTIDYDQKWILDNNIIYYKYQSHNLNKFVHDQDYLISVANIPKIIEKFSQDYNISFEMKELNNPEKPKSKLFSCIVVRLTKKEI